MQWDAPTLAQGGSYGASGWNRPTTLQPLDQKFNVERAKREARERIKDQHRKVCLLGAGKYKARGGGGGRDRMMYSGHLFLCYTTLKVVCV